MFIRDVWTDNMFEIVIGASVWWMQHISLSGIISSTFEMDRLHFNIHLITLF